MSLRNAFASIPTLFFFNDTATTEIYTLSLHDALPIFEILHRAYPDHAILAEESGASAGNAGESEYTWIIDPLDGTTNFIHGFPQYAVSVALRHKGLLAQAVIYDPTSNELFTATRGRGAYLNERRIRVSKRAQLSEALLGTGFPFRDLPSLDEC